MKRLIISGIALTSLFLTTSCSSLTKSSQTEIASNDSMSGHMMDHMNHGGNPSTTKIELISPKNVSANKSIPLTIIVKNNNGTEVKNFDTFQTKQIHLIVVSDNLSYFTHIHPSYKGNGRFDVNETFPQPGSYTLFASYKPTGQEEQVAATKINIPGNASTVAETINYNRTDIVGNTKVNLNIPTNIKAGSEVNFLFDLQDKSNNQQIQNLQLYLGEKGHLVVIKQSESLTASDYLHIHPLKDGSSGQVHFMTTFSQPGKYKLWLQFQRNNKINTASFWVNVV